MNKIIAFLLGCFIAIPLLAQIHSGFDPAAVSLQAGDTTNVQLYLDASHSQASVGSFTARITWDKNVLEFENYKLQNDASTVVLNDKNVANGELAVSIVAPAGLEKNIRYCTLGFKLRNSTVQSTSIHLEYTAMAAAKSFQNLLQQLETENCTVTTNAKNSETR